MRDHHRADLTPPERIEAEDRRRANLARRISRNTGAMAYWKKRRRELKDGAPSILIHDDRSRRTEISVCDLMQREHRRYIARDTEELQQLETDHAARVPLPPYWSDLESNPFARSRRAQARTEVQREFASLDDAEAWIDAKHACTPAPKYPEYKITCTAAGDVIAEWPHARLRSRYRRRLDDALLRAGILPAAEIS